MSDLADNKEGETPRTREVERKYQSLHPAVRIAELALLAETLERELNAMRKDAERYRWLRECRGEVCAGVEQVGFTGNVQWLDTTDLDAAIDAGRAG